MKGVELYGRVRYAVQIEGLSHRAAARRFGIDPRTVAKMMKFTAPPGYVRTKPPAKPKLDSVHPGDRPGSLRRQVAPEETTTYGKADLRASPGRIRLHGRPHDCEGLRRLLASAGSRDVCAAGASAGTCPGRLWRSHRRHRRRGAQDPLLRF